MSAKKPSKEEEDFYVVDKSSIPRGSILKPCQLSIEVLKDKYRNVKMQDIIDKYMELTRELFDVQTQLRELNILEGYKRMTPEQQALQLLYESHMDQLKQRAGMNNIVAITRHPDIFNTDIDSEDNFPFKMCFYKTLDNALAYTDGLPLETQESILITPLFLTI